MKNIVKLITFGQGGDTVYYATEKSPYGGTVRHTTSGYRRPDNPREAPDGTPVIDMTEAVKTKQGVSWVFKGPLVDVDLPDNEITKCPEPEPIFAQALAESSASFGTMLAMQKTSTAKAGPLDQVSISDYIKGWREHGARIGKYKDNQIVWEN